MESIMKEIRNFSRQMETIIILKKGQMKILEVKNKVTEESICWSKQQTKQSREKDL